MEMIYLLLMLSLVHGCCCMDVYLSAPRAVRTGENITLTCRYNMTDCTIKSVKVFLGQSMIYDNKHLVHFPFNNSSVLHDCGNESCVSFSLLKVTKLITGYYKCQVSAYHWGTASHIDKYITSYIVVTEDPTEEPTVSTDKAGYTVGERIPVKCVSKAGYPPADLSWSINGEKVAERRPSVLKQYVDKGDSVSELQLLVTPSMPDNSSLHISCTAIQYDLYNSTGHLVISEAISKNSGSEKWSGFLSPLMLVSVCSSLIVNSVVL